MRVGCGTDGLSNEEEEDEGTFGDVRFAYGLSITPAGGQRRRGWSVKEIGGMTPS